MNSSLQGKTALVTVYPGKKTFITSGVWLDYPLMASMEIVEKTWTDLKRWFSVVLPRA